MEGIGGGVIGAAVAMLLVSALSKVGAVIALTAIIIVALYICSGGALGRWIVSGLQRLNPAFSKLGSGTKEFFTKSQKEDDDSTSIKVRAKEKGSKPALKEAAKLADKRKKKKGKPSRSTSTTKKLPLRSPQKRMKISSKVWSR